MKLFPPLAVVVRHAAGGLVGLGMVLFTGVRGQAQTVPPAPIPTSIENVLAYIPPTTNLRLGSTYNAASIKQAESAIVLQTNGQPGVLRYKVESVEPSKNYGFDYVIATPTTPTSWHGVPLKYRTWAYFREAQGAALAKIRPGMTVVVGGTFNRVNVVIDGGMPLLRMDLDDAQIYNTVDAATTALNNRGSNPPGTTNPGGTAPGTVAGTTEPKSDFVGTWDLSMGEKNAPPNHQYVMNIRADGTWTWDREFSGTWTVEDGYLNVRFKDHPDYLDRYALPVRNGELHGSTASGDRAFTLRRRAGTPSK